MPEQADLEIELKTESSKAVITGKTSVPFRTFVGLILQRKVFQLFKQWEKDPVILSSELLTQLASAPQDSQENRTHLIIVTLGVGVLTGIFLFSAILVLLSFFNVFLDQQAFAIIAVGLLSVALLGFALARLQRLTRAQKIADAMERTAQFLSKK
jgi:pilus assembly protein TadC